MTLPTSVQDSIIASLTKSFHPISLHVCDESEQHKHHAGSPGGGETHFRIFLLSDCFSGKSRVERHRMVHEVLSPFFRQGLHALCLSLQSPEDSGVSDS